jgi:hypothetical protein
MGWLDWVDYVKAIVEGRKLQEKWEVIVQDSMVALHDIAMWQVREAFNRVFINEIRFPEVETQAAIPYTWDNVRIDFPVSDDTRLKVADIVDWPTWITFNWFKVDWPIAWILLQARVPLKNLSPNWIESIK